MREVRFEAVSGDGRLLRMRDDEGDEVVLPVDARTRQRLRDVFGDPAAQAASGAPGTPAQLEIRLDSQLTPREIQARLRAGETSEEVARAAGVPVERVRRFEGPILDERAWVARQAARCAVHGAADPAPVAEVVQTYAGAAGVDPDSIAWDSWRIEPTRWAVTATWEVGSRTRSGRFDFDPSARRLLAVDDTALGMVGLRPAEPLRLAPPPEEPPQEPPRAARPGEPGEPVDGEPDDQPTIALETLPQAGPEAAAEPAGEPAGEPAAPAAPSRRKGRPHVPSWDEIVFGPRHG